MASGPPLTSVGGHCHFLGGEVANRDQISAAMRERVQRGVDVVKVMASGGMTTPGTDVMGTQFSADEMHLLVGLARETGLPITAHAHSLAAVEQSVDAGVDCIEHCSCVTEKGSVLSDDLVASIADRDIAISAVLNPNPQMDLSQAPPAIRKRIATTGWTSQRMRERRVDMLHRLHAGGVRMATGIDAGIGPWVAHGNLHRGVSQLEDAGFSPGEAVAAATSEAARVCGLKHRKGLLRKGYDADLLVVDGDLQTYLTACNGCAWSCSLGDRSVKGRGQYLVTALVAQRALASTAT